MIQVGDTYKATYVGAPVDAAFTYPIGTIVTIMDDDGNELAQFVVTETDTVTVIGKVTVVWVDGDDG